MNLVITIFSILFCCQAKAADFKITAPASWQIRDSLAEPAFSAVIYQHLRERVVTQVFATEHTTLYFQNDLSAHKSEIEKARAQFFSEAGLSDFAILEIQKKPHAKFKFVETIQARFRDLNGHDVQMLERQFFIASRMYVVTYLIDAVALNDRAHAELVMDFFAPVAPHSARAPASNEMTEAQPTALVSEPSDSAAPAVQELNMQDPANQKRCESVPVEKRRTPFDPSFSGLLKDNFAAGKGCVMGVFDNVIAFVKGIEDAGVFAVHYAYSWVRGTPYADQVNASVGAVAAEVKKNPSAFASRIVAGAFNAGVKYVGDFFQCMNSEAQMHAICTALLALTPKTIVALAMKAPEIAIDAAEISSAMAKAVGSEARIARAATEARRVAILSDGARVYETDGGVRVTVSDGPRLKSSVGAQKTLALPKPQAELTLEQVRAMMAEPLPGDVALDSAHLAPELKELHGINGALSANELGAKVRPLPLTAEEAALDVKVTSRGHSLLRSQAQSAWGDDLERLQLEAQPRPGQELKKGNNPYVNDHLNKKTLSALGEVPEAEDRGRIRAASNEKLNSVFNAVRDNPVASLCRLPDYDLSGQAGLCYGRAVVAYVEALKHGIAKDAIKKVWLVGSPSHPDSEKWNYHVATAIRGASGEWYVMDTNWEKLQTVKEWYEAATSGYGTGASRLYFTEPTRLTPAAITDPKWRPKQFFNMSDVKLTGTPYFRDAFQTFKSESQAMVEERGGD